MLAARIHEVQTPLSIDEVPIPQIAADEVLIRTATCSLTATAVRMVSTKAQGGGRREDRAFPYIMGGDPAGVVAETGSAVRGIRPGDRVIVVTQVGCKICHNCRTDREHICLRRFRAEEGKDAASGRAARQGSMAEYVKAPYHDLVKIPEGVSFGEACQVGPLAGACRAIKRTGLKPAESIVVSGATGNYGTRSVLLALAMGAGLVIALGRNADRLRNIRNISPGRIETVLTSDGSIEQGIRRLTDGWGAHRLVDFVPRAEEVTGAALRGLRPGGRGVLVSEGGNLELNYTHIQKHGIEITGSTGSTYHDYPEVVELLDRAVLPLSAVELRPFPLQRVNEAIDVMAERAGDKPFWCYLTFGSAAGLASLAHAGGAAPL